MFSLLKHLLAGQKKDLSFSHHTISYDVDEMERVSLEDEVLDITINGHGDNGSDDVAECIDEPQESNFVNAK